MPTFFEFFAGGGMARAGLGPRWRCLFANDFDHKKAVNYRKNWGDGELQEADVRNITPEDLPSERPDLVWASFPCQDLSLAGGGAGLKGDRSGTFWPFWNLIRSLNKEGRGPSLIVLENVCGTLSSHGGKDFAAIGKSFAEEGYLFGAIVADAALFLPQSRKRLFIIGAKPDVKSTAAAWADGPERLWHPHTLRASYAKLPPSVRSHWIWWRMRPPGVRNQSLVDIIEDEPSGVPWHSASETTRLLSLMSEVNLAKVSRAKAAKHVMVGTLYRRTRRDVNGDRVQRAEVRFDDVAGCLRTPAGGSSRQLIMIVKDGKVRSRLLSPRETARLMGLPDNYVLPENTNEAFHLTGDGVVVPVVRHIAASILEPLLRPSHERAKAKIAA